MDANRRDLLKDRSWMNYKNASDRRKPEYEDGVNTFLDFAFSNAGNNEKIRCPCVSCYLGSYHDRKVVFYHLLARGIIKDYNPWTQHGEDEKEDESIPCEIHIPISHEEHLPNPRIENNVRGSRSEKITSGDINRREKQNQAVHLESDEDRNSPIIPANVWNYVNAIGTSKTGGDVHQGNDDDDDNDNGDPNVSIGEDNNFFGVDNCDSSPNQSCDDADFVATEADQVAADGYSSEAAQAQNSGNGMLSTVRRRGPRGLKWKKELEKSSERVKVELPAKLGRVVGTNARQFVVEASWLLKETLPPNVVKWKDLNPNDVAKLLKKVKDRFIFPNESHVDTALLWQFKQWYRAWRSDLRRSYFSKYDTYDEQLAHRPPYVKEEHWKWLVDYWSSEKFKNISAINSKVRSNTKAFACVGPTSIARLAYELEMNQSKQDSDQCPVYIKLYEKQKRRSDKTWITKEAEDGYNKLVKLHKKQLEDHGVDNLSPSEAYAKTFTKAKSITLLGLGENPIALEGSSMKRRRTGCSDQRIIDASVRARRLEIESVQKSDDDEEEEQTELSHSDRQLRAEMCEQIRLIRQGLTSSSTNA
ncbi:hypothetical protein V2J09_020342 [Rumex salicifolius]